jgi:signal transduction histidine kinase
VRVDQPDELRSEIAELRASRERIVLAADADRHMLERDLHRGVQQHLVALAVNLQLAAQQLDADPDGARVALEGMRRDVERALADAAALAQRIDPPLLDAGLVVAIRAAVAGMGFPVSVEVDVIDGCPPEVARTVLRCCQRLLEQAEARPPASVAVREDAGDVVVEVVVRGADADGEDALRDRVEALGGRLEIVSAPVGATRLTARLPLVR